MHTFTVSMHGIKNTFSQICIKTPHMARTRMVNPEMVRTFLKFFPSFFVLCLILIRINRLCIVVDHVALNYKSTCISIGVGSKWKIRRNFYLPSLHVSVEKNAEEWGLRVSRL